MAWTFVNGVPEWTGEATPIPPQVAQSGWNAPADNRSVGQVFADTLGPMENAGAIATGIYDPFAPARPTFEQMANVGPEDADKSQLQVFGEQFAGNLGKTLTYPAQQLDRFAKWLGSPIGAAAGEDDPTVGGKFGVDGKPKLMPFGSGGRLGLRGSAPGGGFDIPLPAEPQMPGVPAPQFADGQGYIDALGALGPEGLPMPEAPEYAQRQMPVRPDTAPLERTIESLQKNAPQEIERGWFEKYGPAIISGLAGAAVGPGGLLLAPIFHLRNIKQMAEQDERVRAAKQQNDLAVFSAQSNLAELNQAYEQAMLDTQDTNEERRVSAQNRLQELTMQRAEAERAHEIQLVESKFQIEQAMAEATNRYRLQQAQQSMEKYKIDLQRAQPRVSGGAMTYQTTDAQGNPVMRVHQLGNKSLGMSVGALGGGGGGANGKLPDWMLPETEAFAKRQLNWDANLQMGNPWGGAEVVLDDVFEQLPSIVPGFDQLAEEANEQLAAQGIFAASPDYPEAYRAAIMQSLMNSMVNGEGGINPELFQLFEPYSPYAGLFLDAVGAR